MKKLTFTLTLILFLATSALAATPLTSAQIRELFDDRTFQVTGKGGPSSTTFFSKDGRYSSVTSQSGGSSVKYTKNGSWKIVGDGVLCINSVRHTTARKKREQTCGKVVRTGQKTFQRYDEQGKLHSTFTYIGKGNRLP